MHSHTDQGAWISVFNRLYHHRITAGTRVASVKNISTFTDESWKINYASFTC